jgi:segregation and condensation protein B
MDKTELKNILEALIFASESPLSIRSMRDILEDVEQEEIEAALDLLKQDLESRAVSLKKVSGGYQFATKPEYAPFLKSMFTGKEQNRLSRAALETLAIIAFKQPISRVEVNAIRGVSSDGVIKTLLERKLVDIAGRDDGPGRALLFKTTTGFLRYFGINDLSDLPRPKEVEQLLAEGEGSTILKNVPEERLLDSDEEEEETSDADTDGENQAKKDPNNTVAPASQEQNNADKQ